MKQDKVYQNYICNHNAICVAFLDPFHLFEGHGIMLSATILELLELDIKKLHIIIRGNVFKALSCPQKYSYFIYQLLLCFALSEVMNLRKCSRCLYFI